MWLPALALLLTVTGCKPSDRYTDTGLALAWARMSLDVTKATPGNSPTYASRCFGYLGVAMYESVVHGSRGHQSLVGQLSMLDRLSQPETGLNYDWALSLNAAQAEMLRSLYRHATAEWHRSIDSLELDVYDRLESRNDESIARLSAAYGRQIARELFAWSKTDGGHRAYLRNFDKALVHPDRPGGWKPPLYAQSFSHHPLHPDWGNNRPFIPANYQLAPPDFIAYDTTPGSPYYEQFRAVYEKDLALTRAEKEAAIWWGDDPDETFTPPGHSYYIATLLLEGRDASLVECAETFARTGIAVADAFINCWRWKYEFFSERPNTFIPAYIDEEWESFWPDPPFPAFPSGHAIQAAAAATVLQDLHGDDHPIVDRAHEGRERDEVRDVDFPVRRFERLSDIARETADSRFYGGIHTPQDNDRGLEQGAVIGHHVNDLQWKQ